MGGGLAMTSAKDEFLLLMIEGGYSTFESNSVEMVARKQTQKQKMHNELMVKKELETNLLYEFINSRFLCFFCTGASYLFLTSFQTKVLWYLNVTFSNNVDIVANSLPYLHWSSNK